MPKISEFYYLKWNIDKNRYYLVLFVTKLYSIKNLLVGSVEYTDWLLCRGVRPPSHNECPDIDSK